MAKPTKHSLKAKIIRLRRGVAIYQTHASPYYFARVLDTRANRYKVRSTKEKDPFSSPPGGRRTGSADLQQGRAS